MRASYLALTVAGLSVAAIGAYALLAAGGETKSAPEPATTRAAVTPSGQGIDSDVAALRRELSRLRSELRANGRSVTDEASTVEAPFARELARLAKAMERLESDVGALRAQVDHRHGPSLAAGERMGLPDSEQMKRQAQEESMARAQELESGFDLEGEDPQWSQQTTNEVLQALAHKEIAGAQVYDAQCRSTLCRVEVEYTDPAQRSAFQIHFPYLVRRSLPRMSIHTQDLEDGRQSMVIYLARQGHDMPARQQGLLN